MHLFEFHTESLNLGWRVCWYQTRMSLFEDVFDLLMCPRYTLLKHGFQTTGHLMPTSVYTCGGQPLPPRAEKELWFLSGAAPTTEAKVHIIWLKLNMIIFFLLGPGGLEKNCSQAACSPLAAGCPPLVYTIWRRHAWGENCSKLEYTSTTFDQQTHTCYSF